MTKRNGLYDGTYDHTQHNIDTGWFIGIDTSEKWDYFKHPFYFDENGNLVMIALWNIGIHGLKWKSEKHMKYV
jgi:hypothetical protein